MRMTRSQLVQTRKARLLRSVMRLAPFAILHRDYFSSRSACANNLKQIGVGLHAYYAIYQGFPPGQLNLGSTTHNWCTLILPHIEQDNVYRQYNFTVTWSNAANDSGLIQTQIKTFICP